MNKSILKSIICLFLLFSYSIPMYPKCITMSISVSDNPIRYRISIKSNAAFPVEFSESSFFMGGWRIAPYAASIAIRDNDGKYIYLGEDGRYSSNDKISELFNPPDKWRFLHPKQTWISEWFSIADLGDGIKKVATEKDPKKWKDFRITFWIKINRESPIIIEGDSGWILTEKINLDELIEANKTR